MTEFITGLWETLSNFVVLYGLSLIGSALILIIGRWVVHFLVRTARTFMEKAKVDKTLVNFGSNLLYYALMAFVILAALQNLGFTVTSIVAVFGAATLAVGLALQDSLSNFAAGVMLILFQQFKVGDFVELSGEFGRVEEIRIFNTVLVSPDNKTIIIPNGTILSNTITNYSKKGIIRRDLTYGISYNDNLLKAKQVLQQILIDNDKVLSNPAPVVAVAELGDSSVNFTVRPYIKVEHYLSIPLEITEQVKLRFDEAGIEMPYPQRDVHFFPVKETA